MNKDFEILENVEMNGKEFIIYFNYENYNDTMTAIYDIYNKYFENYITNNFKCTVVFDIEYSNTCFDYDETIDTSYETNNSVEGYYFLFDSKEEMEKCIDHLNSIKIAWELGGY